MKNGEFRGVVQFPHPGSEHKCTDGWTGWNTDDHRRKFLLSEATYLDEYDAARHGEVAFWGEWEAPSERVTRWPSDGNLPRSLVRPRFPGPLIGTGQNTDPYVFGDSFKYSICKQLKRAGTNGVPQTTYLAQLAIGSLILFGSKLDHRFVLDTAFVVGSSVDYTPATWANDLRGTTSAAYRSVTLAPANNQLAPELSGLPLRLYSGATHSNPLHGMYSFFPCLPVGDGAYPRFRRPSITLDKVINPALMMGFRGRRLPQEAIAEVWNSVRQQVLDADRLLGVAADEPPKTRLAPGLRRGLPTPGRC